MFFGRVLGLMYFARGSLGGSVKNRCHLKNTEFILNTGYCKLQIKTSLVDLV